MNEIITKAEPVWILKETVFTIHSYQIVEFGGLKGIRDEVLLESGLNRPMEMFYDINPKPKISSLAAYYSIWLIKNRPFFDGNKRVSFVIGQLFLKLNGFTFKASAKSKSATYNKLTNNNLSEQEFINWFEINSLPMK